MSTRPARERVVLAIALAALAVLFAAWFWNSRHWQAGLLVFALPPAVLSLGVLGGRRTAGFWAGVLALGWFSHGVMVAYSRPPERGLAWLEIGLALAVVAASSTPGLRRRFSRRKPASE